MVLKRCNCLQKAVLLFKTVWLKNIVQNQLSTSRSKFFNSTEAFNASKAWTCQKFVHAYKEMSLVLNGVKHKRKIHITLAEELLQGKSSGRWVLLTCSRQSWSWAAWPAGLPGSEADRWGQGSSWSAAGAFWTSPSCATGVQRTELRWPLLS